MISEGVLMFQEKQTTQFSMFEWMAPLFELPARLPPATPAWNGHIPFPFLLFSLARLKHCHGRLR
jgi:hypothetical protein